MTSPVIESDFYVDDGGTMTPYHLAVTSPEPTGEGDSCCKVQLSPLLRNEKTIIGVDGQQAKQLAVEFVRSLLLGKKLRDMKGAALDISDILSD